MVGKVPVTRFVDIATSAEQGTVRSGKFKWNKIILRSFPSHWLNRIKFKVTQMQMNEGNEHEIQFRGKE